ncbi:unnamed protein product, partial [Ranitomeya imitator]
MGSNVAPPYANAYMAHFEESVIYRHHLFISNVLYWMRYIDDIFCLWGGTLESLDTFFTFLNEAWPGIRFTITHDTISVSFLDTTVLKDQEGHLTTDLHTKPTDRNSVLHFDSFHPPAVKRCIPKSQFQRVRRIVSDQDKCEQRLQDMTTKFHQRGYPKHILEEQKKPPPLTRTNDQGILICPVEGRAKYCSVQALGLSDPSRHLRTAVLYAALNRAENYACAGAATEARKRTSSHEDGTCRTRTCDAHRTRTAAGTPL